MMIFLRCDFLARWNLLNRLANIVDAFYQIFSRTWLLSPRNVYSTFKIIRYFQPWRKNSFCHIKIEKFIIPNICTLNFLQLIHYFIFIPFPKKVGQIIKKIFACNILLNYYRNISYIHFKHKQTRFWHGQPRIVVT